MIINYMWYNNILITIFIKVIYWDIKIINGKLVEKPIVQFNLYIELKKKDNVRSKYY